MEALAHRVDLPGRLGDPDRTIATDPRADPRLVAVLSAFGLAGRSEPAPVDAASPYAAKLELCNAAEPGFQALFAALVADLEPVVGVVRSSETIRGVDGNTIRLDIHRPAAEVGPAPCVLHLHGGGMSILTAADPMYARWRDELAADGLVVIGVEFRNAAGVLGAHPFPAGLDDCLAALRWTHDHRDDLGVSTIVVSGESGGGNLALATTIAAGRAGEADRIGGVYAQCPYISGLYAAQPPELASLTENDDYFLACRLMGAMASLYTPDPDRATDPLAWPYHATAADLAGLPPHVISVNELDPLRDEGLAYFRKLAAAGVSVTSRTVNGTTHAGDVMFPAALPDVGASTRRDLAGFARSL